MSSSSSSSSSSSKSKPDLDCYEGEWRRPVNDLRQQRVGGGHKSIHDNATAAAAGFAGGAPIHGTVHFSQLTPLLIRVYGPDWFERGTISVVFRNAVSHLQPVKAFIEKPRRRQGQVRVWMERLDGKLVFDGTASLGDDPGGTMVDRQLERVKPIRGNLVFVPHEVGTRTLGIERAKLEWGNIIGDLFPFTPEEKLRIITEWHPWFGTGPEDASVDLSSSSLWGGRPILPPEALNQIMLYTLPEAEWPPEPHGDLLPRGATPVGLFGGCEVRMHNGPVFMGRTYQISRELVSVGETPRTEFRWIRTTMRDGVGGKLIAEMTLQDMMLKGTVQNYEQLREVANGRPGRNSKL